MLQQLIEIEVILNIDKGHTRTTVATGHGDTIDHGVLYPGRRSDHIRHLEGGDILALPAERVADAIDEGVVPGRIDPHEITGAEPGVALREDIPQNLALGFACIGIAFEPSRGIATVANAPDGLARFSGFRCNAEPVCAAQGDTIVGIKLHDSRWKAVTQIGRDAADGAWVEADGIIALRQTQFDIPGIELIVPAAAVGDVTARLTAAGAHLLTGAEAYHVRRVELGRPAPGAEITEDFNPLESGLAWACADNKGCYTGQEIIARQLTYDKVTKTLVGLVADRPLAAGAEVTAEDRTVGSVTSAVFSPHLQRYLALAVIKRPYNADATVVDVDGTPAVVTALPFSEG